MIYRRLIDAAVWHFCSNCMEWPKTNYYEKQDRPTDGQLCPDCQAKLLKGDCRALSR